MAAAALSDAAGTRPPPRLLALPSGVLRWRRLLRTHLLIDAGAPMDPHRLRAILRRVWDHRWRGGGDPHPQRRAAEWWGRWRPFLRRLLLGHHQPRLFAAVPTGPPPPSRGPRAPAAEALDPAVAAFVSPTIACACALRWTDHAEVVQLYACVGEALRLDACAADPAWGVKRVRALHAWCEEFLGRGALVEALRTAAPSDAATALASLAHRRPGWLREAALALNLFCRGGRLAGAHLVPPLAGWSDWPPFRPAALARAWRVRPSRRRRPPGVRGVYAPWELSALHAAASASAESGVHPRDLALFLLLSRTGVRSRALGALRAADVVGSTARVLEKNAQWRVLRLDEETAAAVNRCVALARAAGSPWVFPHPRDAQRPRLPAHNRLWLHALCRRAGLDPRQPHCHVHAFRRTVVTQLCEDTRNDLSDVAAFIGHASVAQTQHYWERRPGGGGGGTLRLPWTRGIETGAAAAEDDEARTLQGLVEAAIARCRSGS